jgi:predicted permease
VTERFIGCAAAPSRADVRTIGHDIRYALRQFRRNPGFASVAIVSLAVAIGANSTVFSVMNAIVLRPLPVDRPEELFVASMPTDYGTDFSYPMIQRAGGLLAGRGDICGQSSPRVVQIAAMAAERAPAGAIAAAMPESGQMQLLTGGCFTVLRQRPAAGRLLGPQDDHQLNGHPVAVISDRFWARAFQRAPSAVGSAVLVNGVPLTIVGVARPEFFGTTVGPATPDLWAPVMMQAALRFSGSGTSLGGDWNTPYPLQREIYWLSVMVRVPGNRDAAAAVLNSALERELPAASAARTADGLAPRVVLQPGSRGTSPFRDRIETTLFVLMGMVAWLLLLAAVNIAGVLLARGTARRRELAVRLSLGASRVMVMRHMLVESTLLALAGGVVGLALTSSASIALVTLMNRGAPAAGMDVSPDWRVALATLVATALAGIVAGAFAAWRCTGMAGSEVLRTHAKTSTADYSVRRLSPGALLVSAQMALSVVLLILAGLCVRTLHAVTTIELGFDADQVIVARIDPRSAGYRPQDLPSLYDPLLARIRAVPGVTSASLSAGGPFGGSVSEGTLVVEGFTPPSGQRVRGIRERVTPDYFRTLRLRIVRGRDFTAQDAVPGRRVSVINESFARRYFAGDPIGKRWGYNPQFDEQGYEVIGVVADAKYNNLKATGGNMVYMLASSEETGVYLVSLEVRASAALEPLIPLVRNAIREAAPGLPVRTIEPLPTRIAGLTAGERLLAWLATSLGLMAALLACLGLYGMTSYGVSRRTAEIGIRMALGAGHRTVRRMVLREALWLVASGILLGVPLAVAASRSIQSLLYRVTPTDTTAYLAAVVALTAIAAIAAYLPARRASRLQPLNALREGT